MFVVFEGVDGTGKTTVVSALSKSINYDPPTPNPQRAITTHCPLRTAHSEAEYAADRKTLSDTLIKPLRDAYVILCDRYEASGAVYSGAQTFTHEPGLERPDIVVLCTADKEVIREALTEREGTPPPRSEVNRLIALQDRHYGYAAFDQHTPYVRLHNAYLTDIDAIVRGLRDTLFPVD